MARDSIPETRLMPAGISGELVASAYMDGQLFTAFAGRLGEAGARRALTRLGAASRDATRRLGPASAMRAIVDIGVLPLFDALGYTVHDLQSAADDRFDGTIAATDGTRITLVVVPWTVPLSTATREAAARACAYGLGWALAANGRGVAVCDAARSWSRRWLAFDMPVVFADERSARTLWALLRAEALAGTDGPSLLTAVVAASEAEATAVCSALGGGVIDAVGALAGAFVRGTRAHRLPPHAVLDQAITVVYRLLFLLFAEARSLVPTWHHVYKHAYTVDALWRQTAGRRPSTGTWSALQAIARLAHAGCDAGDLHVTAFNGRLFAPARTPLAGTRVPDDVASHVLLSLATRETRTGRLPVAYGDLGVEELGAVYERVLEYEARKEGRSILLARQRDARKRTGTFYTPRTLTDFLVRRTLAPLVRGRTIDDILSLRIIDPAMGSGAFLVAACRYLAAACERVEPLSDADRVTIRRRIAERCLYGIDVNPMAVQVARLSLWLTTLAADRPLTFLDHHLAVGDSLVGARFEDMARQPPHAGRHRRAPRIVENPLFEAADAETLSESILPERFRLALTPSDTAGAVRAKERRLAALEAPGTPLHRWKHAADLWCAAWFWSGAPISGAHFAELTSQVLGRTTTLPGDQARTWLDALDAVARSIRPLHWELTFPEVFFDASGRRRPDAGFDAVLGNPPWEVLHADHDGSGGPKRSHLLTRFVAASGIYSTGGRGHPNCYRLFLERALQHLGTGGRFGMLLPGGVLSDQQSARVRHLLFSTTSLDTVAGFENGRRIFPIHRGTRFVAITGTTGGQTRRLPCQFGITDPAVLSPLPDVAADEPIPTSVVRVGRDLIERLDPVGLSVPAVTHPLDVAILAGATRRAPALADAEGWDVRFGRELNATDDSRAFVARGVSRAGDIPIVEGKCLEPFRVRMDAVRYVLPRARAESTNRVGRFARRPRLCYREVASADNKLTLIAAILPAGCLSVHTVFCADTPLPDEAASCLMALLNSLVANHIVRRWVTTHVTAAVMARLPVPVPPPTSPARGKLAALAARLAREGVAGAPAAYVRLNVLAAELYGLDAARFDRVLDAFPLIDARLRDAMRRRFTARS